MAQEIGERYRVLFWLSFEMNSVANLLWEQGKLDESLTVYSDSVRASREVKNFPLLSETLHALGGFLLATERFEEALPHLTESAALYARLGDTKNEALVQASLAAAYEKFTETSKAVLSWKKVQAIAMERNDRARALDAAENMARLEQDRDPSLAAQHLRQACELAKELGNTKKESHLLNILGILEWSQGQFEQALNHYEQTVPLLRELEDTKNLGLILNSIGVTLLKLGRYDEALEQLEEAIVVNRANGVRLLEGHGLAARGDALKELGKLDDAFEAYDASLQLRKEVGDRPGEGWMLHRIAELCESSH
jgi:tetratricopeptide (TPR) repeat protein